MQTAALYQRYFSAIARHARRLLGNSQEAEDVAQDTFLRFIKQSLPENERFRLAWLYRVSANLAVDVLRKRKTVANDLVPAALNFSSGLDSNIQFSQTVAALASRVSKDVLRAGLLLHGNRLTQNETAEILGVSERTIRRWMSEFDAAISTFKRETEL
jgi:RNA polymerase sigma-70 factor, ECF subfamily